MQTAATTTADAAASRNPLNQALTSAGLTPGFRLLPDLALPTALDSSLNRGLAFCLGGTASSPGCNLVRAGGSAVAAALFSGISALLAEKYGQQGNLARNLYSLSDISDVYEDVHQGNAQLPCAAGTSGCGASAQIGFSAGSGYDLATGLGSVNAQALVEKWPKPEQTGTQTVTFNIYISPANTNNYYNPSASVTLTAYIVDPLALGTPTGTVTFVDPTTGTALSSTSTATLDSNGYATVTLTLSSVYTAQGVYQIGAIYSGDDNYAAATSGQNLTVDIQKSNTSVTITPLTSAPTEGSTIPVTVTVAVSASSVSPAGSLPPSGQVTLKLAGAPTAESYTATLATIGGVTSATFPAVAIPGTGQLTLQATYPGDPDYDAATSPQIAFTVALGATSTSLTYTGSATLGQLTSAYTFSATVVPAPQHRP